MSYMEIILSAVAICPMIAFVLSGIYFIIQYKKYGSVSFFRTFILYTFLLYCICAYFLVILPLPNREEVAKRTGPTMQLIPFNVIKVFIEDSGFILTKPSTYVKAFTSHEFLQPLFNFLLLLPLGFYLRYYFKTNFKKASKIALLSTLFFEFTQISGLYGIYSRPYRLLDVDDIMLNYSGCMLGFFISPIFVAALPTREEIDQKAHKHGVEVTLMRRIFAKFIDLLICGAIYSICLLFIYAVFEISFLNKAMIYENFENKLPFILTSCYLLISFLYHIVFIYMANGNTPGRSILGIKICDYKEKKLSKTRLLFRYILYISSTYLTPICIIYIYYNYILKNLIAAILIGILLGLCILYFIIRLIVGIFSSKYTYFGYEKLSRTKFTTPKKITTI